MKPSLTIRCVSWSFFIVALCFLPSAGIDVAQASEKGKTWTTVELRQKCADQPRAQIREWFGKPDDVQDSGKNWLYKGMRIRDTESGKKFTTLVLVFSAASEGNVKDVQFADLMK